MSGTAGAADGVLFVGVGRMGGPMAMRLAKAGVPLAVADLSPESLAPFAARGIPVAASGADLPGSVVMTMLPTDRHVREALLGPGGACVGETRRSLVVEMSTASPAGTRALAADLGRHGAALLDAPVSGGAAGARAGTLTAMAGGAAADFERARPLLGAFCSNAVLVGPTGAGHIVKALNNFLSAVTLWSASEALGIGTKLGLDPASMLEVWTMGSGRSHATEVKLPDHVLTGRYDFGQSLALFCKDLGIAAALGQESGIPAVMLEESLRHWSRLRDEMGGEADITEVARVLQDSLRAEE